MIPTDLDCIFMIAGFFKLVFVIGVPVGLLIVVLSERGRKPRGPTGLLLLATILLAGCSQVQSADKPDNPPETAAVAPVEENESELDRLRERNKELESKHWNDLMERFKGETMHAPTPVDLTPTNRRIETIDGKVDALTEAVNKLTSKPPAKSVDVPVKAPAERPYRLLLMSGRRCPACQVVKAYMLSPAMPKGWTIGTTADCHIQVVENDVLARSLGVEMYPTFVLIRDNAEVGRVIPGDNFSAAVFVRDACELFNRMGVER